MTDTNKVDRKREESRRRYGVAYELLRAILFAEDPMGISFEDNPDEYEPEVGTILPRLRGRRSAEGVRKVVHEEFVKWFGPSAGPAEKYQTIAMRVWEEVVPRLRA